MSILTIPTPFVVTVYDYHEFDAIKEILNKNSQEKDIAFFEKTTDDGTYQAVFFRREEAKKVIANHNPT